MNHLVVINTTLKLKFKSIKKLKGTTEKNEVFVLSCLLTFSNSKAQEETPSQGVWQQSSLLGDWEGAKTWLSENGITVAPRITGFYHGMPYSDGITEFEFGGKLDAPMNINLGKLGV